MNAQRRAMVMYLIAAGSFLVAGVAGFVGEVGAAASSAFIVLSIAFVVLALNARQSQGR